MMMNIYSTITKSNIIALIFISMSIVGSSYVYAFRGKCLLSVEGKKYIDGPCDIKMKQDGSFQFDDGRLTTKCAVYDLGPNNCTGASTIVVKKGTFGSLFTEDGRRGQMYWNSGEDRRAQAVIENLSRKGACWSNRSQTVRLCAWR